jgi:hypothetical protein
MTGRLRKISGKLSRCHQRRDESRGELCPVCSRRTAPGHAQIWPALHLEANRSGCLDDSFSSSPINSRRDWRRSIRAAIYAAAPLALAIWASGDLRQWLFCELRSGQCVSARSSEWHWRPERVVCNGSASVFPSNTYNSANYRVDVVFSASPQ